MSERYTQYGIDQNFLGRGWFIDTVNPQRFGRWCVITCVLKLEEGYMILVG